MDDLRQRVRPGDVLVVHDDDSVWASLIRFGAWIRRQPHTWNHVVVAHHVDAAGTFWGIEGRPGGVGPRDLTVYLADPRTLANDGQVKTAEQRAAVCAAMQAMAASDVPYDWPAIALDTIEAVDPIWHLKDQWGPLAPGHVVCSSAADYVYERVGLATPSADRFCTPADWAVFLIKRGWMR